LLYREDGSEDEIPWYDDPHYSKWTYDYDELGNLTQEKILLDFSTYDLNYQYNPDGSLFSETRDHRIIFWPGGEGYSHSFVFERDGLGRATGVSLNGDPIASGGAYFPAGPLSNLNYGNGHSFSQILNTRLQPERMLSQKGNLTALDLTYDYSPRGLITDMIDGVDASNTRSYLYDGQGRLTDASGPWGSGAFTYDSLGNIHAKTLGNRQIDLSYNSRNRLSQSVDSGETGTRNIQYDSRGNITSIGGVQMSYDAADRPTGLSGDTAGSSLPVIISTTPPARWCMSKSRSSG